MGFCKATRNRVSLGDGWIGSPRSRIAATMQAVISNAPFSRCLSMPESIGGEERASVAYYAEMAGYQVTCRVRYAGVATPSALASSAPTFSWQVGIIASGRLHSCPDQQEPSQL